MTISRNNISLILLALLGLVAIWLGTNFFHRTSIKNLDSEGTDIIAFGDSLIQGVGSTDSGDFISELSRRIGQPIINLGHSGDTTADGLARVSSISRYKPKIVIVLLGGNDFLHKVPMDTLFANLGEIVDYIHRSDSAVLLLGIRGGLISDAYASRFKTFAREHNTAFVPNILSGLIGDRRYMYDEVHPNNAGYTIIADKVEPVLRAMLSR